MVWILIKMHSVTKHSSSAQFPKIQQWSPCYKTGKPDTREMSGFAESHRSPLVEPTMEVCTRAPWHSYNKGDEIPSADGQRYNSWGMPAFNQHEEGASSSQLMNSCRKLLQGAFLNLDCILTEVGLYTNWPWAFCSIGYHSLLRVWVAFERQRMWVGN